MYTSRMTKRDDIETVRFVSTVRGLTTLEDCTPKPAKHFTPTWWKDMPPGLPYADSVALAVTTVKMCPSFPEFFSLGYVIPMWADTTIKYSEETDTWEWRCGHPDSPYKISIHSKDQYMNHAPVNTLGVKTNYVFKFESPWKLITPKGWSVLQLPMFYNFSDDFTVAAGTTHTDVLHDTNLQVLYHGNGKEIFIKRGTPLAQFIPYRREKLDMTVSEATEEDRLLFESINLNLVSSFTGGYRKEIRRRNNEE